MPDRTPLTLGESLAAPMVIEVYRVPTGPEANPSVMRWETTQQRVKFNRAGQSAYGLLTHLVPGDDAPDIKPWAAHCFGPGECTFHGTFDTAEEARAAVEEHILAHVDIGLSEESE